MARLTKVQAKRHTEALKLLEKETLTFDEKLFVLENWREDATHINSVSGAFFTPQSLARDFAIEVSGARIIDLCAGIGSLAFAVSNRYDFQHDPLKHIACVEINPDYVAVGRKIVPEATWILADVFSLPAGLGHFDVAISNPPFGRTKRTGKTPRFTGREFEYAVIDIANDLAGDGVFIVPQASAPFEYSGKQYFRTKESEQYQRFHLQTSIALEPNCGIDTAACLSEWKGVTPVVEIVLADFEAARNARAVSTELPERFEDALDQVTVFRASSKEDEEIQSAEQMRLF